jgi:tetratricopeptide (TPR) repeat protein
MPRPFFQLLIVLLGCTTLSGFTSAQSSAKPESTSPSESAKKGISLAEAGRCREALPILKKYAPQAADKEVKVKAGLATVRCGQLLNQTDTVVNALLWLNRDFPTDPEILYVTIHTYSDLSTRAAMQLANTAPQSTPAHELNAEALELQGKWDEAAAEYRRILVQDPDRAGIHYRIGRILLSKPPTETTVQDAREEFQAELKIDPRNAGAEFILGELSKQAQQWDDAIDHFSRAAKLDPNFADAFLGLGLSLNSVNRFAEAIPPLEAGAKLQPDNPTGHYQLAIAYSHVGRKEDARKEAQLQREAAEKIEQARQKAEGAPQQ